MSTAKDVSPVGWYAGTYQLRFVELRDRRKNDLKRRFLTWESTVLVNAKGPAEAHRKVVKIGKAHTKPYKGGADAIDVQWLFEGVIDVLPIYEEIGDGAEIMWAERTKTLKSIRKHAKGSVVFSGRGPGPTSRSTRSRAKARAPG